MAPVATSGDIDRAMRIDALLTNGRAPLYLQLPMLVAWFAGMLHLVAFEALAACGLLKRALPRLNEIPSAIIGLGGVFILALTRSSRATWAQNALMYLYHIIAAIAIALWFAGRRMPACAPSA